MRGGCVGRLKCSRKFIRFGSVVVPYDHNHVLFIVAILFHYGFPDLERFESVAFCPSSRHCPAVSAIFAGRGRKGVSGGPAILITIKSLVPVTHIGAFIGRRLSKGACAASPAPGTPQHQSFYHLLPLNSNKNSDHSLESPLVSKASKPLFLLLSIMQLKR